VSAAAANATDSSKEYQSLSHGVFLRNAHGQEVLLRPDNITWRTLGGSIDLYFYSGPTQVEVSKTYQTSTVGLPAMQQYFTLGYHQCRWGYKSWSDLADVVSTFEKFGIPLENIWTDIDYMNQYRDFENDPVSWSYKDGEAFLEDLHKGGRHYIPIIDAAIYNPNPKNKSDAYVLYQLD
jgi:alpha-glucosidase